MVKIYDPNMQRVQRKNHVVWFEVSMTKS
jgi:hypothetical protein